MNVSYYNNDDNNDETTIFSAQVGARPNKGIIYEALKQEVWYLVFICHKCVGYLITILVFTEFSQSSLYVKMH